MSYVPPQPQNPQNPYAMQQVPQVTPRKKSNTTCFVLTVVGLVMGGMMGLCICGGLFFAFYTQDMPVTAQDRSVVIDGAQVAEFDETFYPQPSKETIEKLKYVDGSIELTYEYDDANNENAPYVMYTVNFEKTRDDANVLYVSQWKGAQIGIGIGGGGDVKINEQPINLGWGDRSRFATVMAHGQPFGNLLEVQKDNTVVVFMIGGLYFDEPTIKELVLPALRRLDSYSPN